MKKIIRKLKGKKVLSFVLAAIMLATTFNIALPMLKLDVEALEYDSEGNIIIDGVTQKQIVTDTSVYDDYEASYLNGAGRSTGIIVPGLDPAQDYVIQGMTYYPERDWMLVTAYHNVADGETTQSSKIFALDAATGEFVAMFSFLNLDGTTANVDHGGGIAVSEHNLYYSCGDKDQKIAYAPLSALENAEIGKHTVIQLVDEIVLYELGDAYTAYVCYDEGVLWAGNFYDRGTKIIGLIEIAAGYNGAANSAYNSMVFGYKLAGNSSEEEWDYLKGKFANLLSVATASGSGTSNGSDFNWTAYKNAGTVNIAGTITAPTAYVGEFTGSFGSFTLTEGVSYTIEFTSNNNATDMYMFAPNSGGHCNVKQSTSTTITKLADGRYHYEMNFTAGLKPTGADSLWPTTQSTDGTYTGAYTLRFDQDAIQAGESREFEITNVKISQTNTYENKQEKVYDEGSAGSPTYALGLNNSLKDVQYAVVDNGKLYLSRSYGSGTGNSVAFGFGDSSWLTVADIDLSVPGTKDVTLNINGTSKTIKAYDITTYTDYAMMPMSEGLCVIDGDIFITFESASNKYLNESGEGEILNGNTDITNCEKPVDVVWQLDPYALMEQEVPEPESSIYYEKVNSLSEIVSGEEYIIVHESPEVDPVTQRNVLYALNAHGGFKDHKLSKGSITATVGYNGMIGHEITEYAIVKAGEKDSLGETVSKDRLYLDNAAKDDIDSVRWVLENIDGAKYKIKTTNSYFANCNSLYFDANKIGMLPGDATALNQIGFTDSGNGNGGFWLNCSDSYYLWCNDGLSSDYNKKITSYYIQNGSTTAAYSGLEELDGTFHCDALNTTGSNIISGQIETGVDTFFADSLFYIYKRVKDDISSTYESRVYTDLQAELQADGTYTIDLETYAISPNHYQYVGERPTDYVLVLDASSSMDTADGTGIISYTDTLYVNSFVTTDEVISKDAGTNIVNGYAFIDPAEDMYYKHTDDMYYQLKLAIHTYDLKGWFGTNDQRYWAYYVTDDGLHYILQNDGSVIGGYSNSEFISLVDNGTSYTLKESSSSAGTRFDAGLVNCTHYRFSDYAGEFSRFTTLKAAAQNLVGQIATQNSDNRIAIAKYGSSTSYLGTSGWATSGYTDAFWSVSDANVSNLKTQINNLSTGAQTDTSGVEMSVAKNIASNSGENYGVEGDRNLAVIYISDGVPGNDSDTTNVKTAANNAIGYAKDIKDAGGFIFTALIGHDSSGFDKKKYMEAISSKYAEATKMDSLGGMSIDEIGYCANLSSCTLDYYFDIGAIVVEETVQNAAVGLDNLDANSYLRQELSDSFKIPANTPIQVSLIKGEFDAIGRFSFTDEIPDPDGIDAVWDEENPGTFTVTGYDYSDEYIAQGREGHKLRVRLEGILADESKTIQNTPISNTATTALYKTKSDMEGSDGTTDLSFKKLPTSYFNIPKYTYVLDYGLQMLDTDVNGTLKAVSEGLTKQDVDNYTRISENGLVKIDDNDLDLLYHTTPTNTTDSGYVLIQRDDGTYDWFEIEVVPASNVYFEETEFATTAGTGTVAWSTATGGTSVTERALPNEGDVDGYDVAYDNTNTYSNGTTFSASVDSSNKRSKTATVSFKGDGIDIISACGPKTGMQIINIKNAETGKSVKASIVDTYYAGDNFTQVPIFSWRGANGTYIVETTAVYLTTSGAVIANGASKSSIKNNLIDTGLIMNSSENLNTDEIQAMLDAAGVEDIDAENLELVWFDDNSVLNGGTGVAPAKKGTRADTSTVTLENYLDGFRIYNPLDTDSSDYAESEKNASYVNVINNLAPVGNDSDSLDGIGFITGSLADGEKLSFSNYESVGPTDELYLLGGTAITFKADINKGEKVMLGLRAVKGATNLKITSNKTSESVEVTVNSATEMFYDITNCIGEIGADETEVQIIVQNTGSNMLAVNQIKFSGGTKVNTGNGNTPVTRSLARSGGATEVYSNMFLPLKAQDLIEVENGLTVKETVQGVIKNGVILPLVENEEEIPGDNTTPDTGDDNTNNDTNTDSGEKEEFSIFSLLELLISLIEKILHSAFGTGNLF